MVCLLRVFYYRIAKESEDVEIYVVQRETLDTLPPPVKDRLWIEACRPGDKVGPAKGIRNKWPEPLSGLLGVIHLAMKLGEGC